LKKGVLSEMTWKEMAELRGKTKVAVVPVGATEQHGPHLPFKHDAASVLYIAEMASGTLYPKVIVTPVMPFGVSFHHMRYDGTISVRPETLTNVIFDICESLLDHGIRKILILNGHGGNFETLSTAVITVNRQLGIDVFFANYWDFFSKEDFELVEDGQIPGHSAEFETSMALHIYPEMVRTHLIKDSDHADTKLSDSEKIMFEKSRMYRLIFEKSPTGVPRGNPTLASAKKGEKIIDVVVSNLARFLKAISEDS